jgi:hypothetical protein
MKREEPRAELVDPKDILNIAQLAKRLGVTEGWIRSQLKSRARARSKHPLPVKYFGRTPKFVWQQVSAWLLERDGQP